ncbi:hypothetical protein QJR26_12380 [Clostridium baratii]
MNEQEIKMRKKLEEQFYLLAKASKACTTKDLEGITSSMVNIYGILHPSCLTRGYKTKKY